MNNEKQARAKRGAPMPQTAAEPVPAAEAPQATASAPEFEANPALPAPVPKMERGADSYFTAYRATLASFGESQMAVASDMTAMALEMSSLAASSLMAAGDGVAALLTARSPADAVEAHVVFARRSIDAMAGGSTRIGELGLRLANDAAKSMLRPVTTV
jgi:hypothetical protein